MSRYSDHETALILKRAAELQEGLDGRDALRSLEEIQSAAAEVGISPTFVAEAAGELEPVRPTFRWLGAPTRFHAEVQLPATLDIDAVSELLDIVRGELGVHGEVQQVLDTVEWRGRCALGASIVTFAPRRGGTRIAAISNRADHAFVVALGSGGVGALSAAAAIVATMATMDSALAASVVVAAAGVAGALGSARLFWGVAARHWRNRTRALVDRIAERAAALASAGMR